MARVMPIMSQGQHLKLNKNTEDKIALFHCDMLPSYRTMKYKSPIWGYFHVQKE